MTAMSMTIETVSAFNGLDVLVARDEGLFGEDGLNLRVAERTSGALRSTANGTLTAPATSQGILQNRGEAAMFQG
jgi:hypothetical protein